MSELGERVLVALADQGFGVIITDEDVRILSQDRKRHHVLTWGYFFRNDRVHMNGLRVVVAGLEFVEGFVPPAGFWDNP